MKTRRALLILFMPLSVWATPLTLCVPHGRAEFMEIVALIARDRGYFKKHGVEVQITEVPVVKAGEYKAKSGRISRPRQLDYEVADKVGTRKGCDLGASNVERFLGESKGSELVRPLFMSTFGDQYDTHVVVAKNSPLTKVEQLRGKKLRLGQLPTYVAALGMLEKHGMSLDDLTIQSGFGGSGTLKALAAGKIDATTAYLPKMAYALATDSLKVLEPNIINKYLGRRIPHSLFVINTALAKSNPRQVEAIKSALKESHTFLMRNREEMFYAFRRSRGYFDNAETIEAFRPNAAKAASFVGEVPFIDMTVESSERDLGYCDTRFYGSELVKRGLFERSQDLAGWIGIQSPETKTCVGARSVSRL